MSEPDKNKNFQDPTDALQAAIEELSLFAQPDVSRLEVGVDGRLIAAQETPLEKIVGLARGYLGQFLSDQVRQKQKKKLEQIKQAILKARDIVQSHSALIEKLEHGNEAQRKLATYALEAIQRYNTVVEQDHSSLSDLYTIYNYERKRLLLDQEIKGHRIELARTVSIKYESHPDTNPAHKMLKELSAALTLGAVKKQYAAINPTHKKSTQFMVDTFRMKSIRMLQTHFMQTSSLSFADVLQLIQQTPIEVEEKGEEGILTMRQLLEVEPGSMILLTGDFKRHTDAKFMTMPILDSFRLSSQVTHSGFPYPSQHIGWALADKWVEAFPLRADQVPLFQQIEQKRKQWAHQLLFDPSTVQKMRRHYKMKREIFDQERTLFLSFHRQLQEILRQGAGLSDEHADVKVILDAFYQEAQEASSAFDVVVQTQQQLADLFFKQPLQVLEEDWLECRLPLLRSGSSENRFKVACQQLKQQQRMTCEQLDLSLPRQAFIHLQGPLLGQAFQSIVLQYQSEKMGFAPPTLNHFERQLQICAFHQLAAFIQECNEDLESLDTAQIKSRLLKSWSQELQLLRVLKEENRPSLSLAIVQELESYFQTRYEDILLSY